MAATVGKRIVVVGDIRQDMAVKLRSAMPVAGVFYSDAITVGLGGKAANQAVAARRLGADVRLFGLVGGDEPGGRLLSLLRAEGMRLDGIRVCEGRSSETVLIILEPREGPSGTGCFERMIAVRQGLIEAMTPEYMESIPIGASDVVVSPLCVPQESVTALYRRAKDLGATTILNATERCAGKLLELTDYVVLNEAELDLFAPPNARRAPMAERAGSIAARHDQAVIVTMGGGGAYCVKGDCVSQVQGYRVPVIDTTGQATAS